MSTVAEADGAAHEGIELKPFRRKSVSSDGSRHDSDEDDDFEILPSEIAPTHQRKLSSSTMQSFELYTPEEERAVIRKLDRRVVLFMSFLYLLAFIDRSNIGNAKIAGMTTDLGLKDDQFEWLLTGFYITYIGFEWMIMLYHVLTPHIYISICVISWGLVASLQAVTTTFRSMLILRLLLGTGEAAFSPGVPFYLSFFYRREELAFRAGIQVSAAPLAASFAGSLAWLITKLGQHSPLAPWRLLFLMEGFPSIIAGIIAWNFVADSPEKAKFLTERERKVAKLRLRNEDGSSKKPREKSRLKEAPSKPGIANRIIWREIAETLRDPKCYITAVMFLSCNIAFSSMPVFLPSVINEMGYSSISSQGLSAPPYLVAFFVVLATAKASDLLRTRTPFICFHALLGFAGYTLIAIGGSRQWGNIPRYLCVYPAAMGFFSSITLLITITMNNQESNAKKGMGMTILNVVGQLGPLLGTRLYPDTDKPYYVKGMSVCAAAMLLVFCLGLMLRVVLIRENKRRAAQALADDEARSELLAHGEETEPRRDHFVLML